MSRKLQNYVRTYRRRAGLSQDEVAFLLGCQSGSKASRYERFARQPTLKTVFAYEAIFGTPARELFAGVYQQALAAIQARARLLKEDLEHPRPDSGNPSRRKRKKPDRRIVHKLELLSAISLRR